MSGAWFDVYEKAVKIHVEFYSFLYRIEVELSGLPLRNVLWNCAAVPEGFAVGCEDSEDTGFCPLRIMWCAPEHLCKQHIILMDRAIDPPLCTC